MSTHAHAGNFLTPDSPDAFVDHAMLEPQRNLTEVCPVCKGHGGWNLQLNAYGLPAGYEDTPENRKLYCHFRACCSACWGYGYIEPGTCAHDWESNVRNVGNCLNVWRCRKCGHETTVDSSD